MTEHVLINGQPMACIDVHDRGLLYGDGLFETIAISKGRPCLWQQHLQRLHEGCHRLKLSCPDDQQWLDDVNRLADNRNSAVIKLMLTRGQGGRGYQQPDHQDATRIVMRSAKPDYPPAWDNGGVRLKWCETRLGHNPLLAGLKHLNRLEQVMARSEWPGGMDANNFAEGVMMDSNGYVVEGVSSNIFLVSRQKLFTPDLSGSGVAGVMRAKILEVAGKLGIDCHVCCLKPDDFIHADEVFISNSLIGLWIVRELGNNHYPVGPIASKIKEQIKSVCFA